MLRATHSVCENDMHFGGIKLCSLVKDKIGVLYQIQHKGYYGMSVLPLLAVIKK